MKLKIPEDNYTRLFIIILVFALLLRLYYFDLTANQPLWWDEADYMAYAKNLAGYNVDWVVSTKHNSIFPHLAAGLFGLGFSETAIKFILEIIPSILLVILTYYLALLMYDNKKIALISSVLMASFWDILFNSMRFHLEAPALLAAFLAMYVFWQGYVKKERVFGKFNPNWSMVLTFIFLILTYAIRRQYVVFVFFFIIYLLLTKLPKELLKDKYNWFALVTAIMLFLAVENFIFVAGLESSIQSYADLHEPVTLTPLGVFEAYFSVGTPILLYFFLIGFLLLVFTSVFKFKERNENKIINSDMFNFIAIVITLLFFILVLRPQENFGDSRWYFPLLFASFVAIARLSDKIMDFVKPYKKYAGLVIVALILWGVYGQVNHSDLIISSKVDSFQGIREAGLFLKENSGKDDLIIVVAQPQAAYYAERPVQKPKTFADWNGTNTDVPLELVLEKINERPEAKYFIITFSEPNHVEWMQKINYANVNGQIVMVSWEIPFMDTKIDFINQQQDIKQEKSYDNITFKLLTIKHDAFVYEIIRK